MSRMTIERALDRPSQPRMEEAVILGLSNAVQGLTEAVKRLREEQDTRYRALEARLNDAIHEMDALVTGLHQDSANVIIRYRAMMQWLSQQFPKFEHESQVLLERLVGEAAATAEKLFTDEAPTLDDPIAEAKEVAE